MNIESMKVVAVKKIATTKFKLNQNAPEILLGVGLVGLIGAGVWAVKETFGIAEKKHQMDESLDRMETYFNRADIVDAGLYPKEEYDENRMTIRMIFVTDLIKAYGPSVVVAVLSVGAILKGHNIMTKRNAALAALYSAAARAYKEYRDRVREELGPEVDDYIIKGKHVEGGLKVVDAKKKEIKFDELEADLPGEISDVPSQFATFFDEGLSPAWQPDGERNKFFLLSQQKYMNDRLRGEGFLFLNTVLEFLGLQLRPEGQLVGWIYNPDNPEIDSFVDFDLENEYNLVAARTFGSGGRWLLDFNVDGLIFDKI